MRIAQNFRKRILACLLAVVMAFAMIPMTAFAAVDSSSAAVMTEVAPTTTAVSAIQPLASTTVTLGVANTTDTVALIQTALQGALNAAASGDTVTVEGTYVNNTLVSTAGTLTLSIPAGRTLRWQAVYEGTVNTADMIAVSGFGTLDVAAGGSIVNNDSGNVINDSGGNNSSLIINVSGGTVSHNSTASGREAIGCANVNVSGGTVSSAGGTRPLVFTAAEPAVPSAAAR